jgi:hypothetical protein
VGGAPLGLFLIIIHNIAKGRRSDIEDAVSLGLFGLGFATGLKLIAVSLGTLASQGPAGPYSDDDLGFITVAGGILVLASYKGISQTFRRK